MRLEVREVDLTTLSVDAIVNAANAELAPGGGVCGAIHRAAGPALALACKQVGPCPTGEARITPGFELPARFVIHAVGPAWHGGGAGEPALLASAYRSSLRLGGEHGVRTIGFPAISTGIYGYPLIPATLVAVTTVRAEATHVPGLELVIFACLGAETVAAYAAHGITVRDRQ